MQNNIYKGLNIMTMLNIFGEHINKLLLGFVCTDELITLRVTLLIRLQTVTLIYTVNNV